MKNLEYYMPHKAVVREAAQTTKVRIVYDVSVKNSSKNVSLNERLETGPPLQNLIWDILTGSRFRPVLLCEDIEKAFCKYAFENLRGIYYVFTGSISIYISGTPTCRNWRVKIVTKIN